MQYKTSGSCSENKSLVVFNIASDILQTSKWKEHSVLGGASIKQFVPLDKHDLPWLLLFSRIVEQIFPFVKVLLKDGP